MKFQKKSILSSLFIILGLLFPALAFSSTSSEEYIDLTHHMVGYMALIVFVLAYVLVIMEEQLHLRKSKPVLLAAGVIWVMIAWVYQEHGFTHAAEVAIRHNFLEYAELFFLVYLFRHWLFLQRTLRNI